MKLYHMSGSCSLGIHILLEDIGKPYELEQIDLASGSQFKEPFVSLNPKSKVPALLRDDGSMVTEWTAIAWYLARSNPDAGLLPSDVEGEVRLLEAVGYMTATVHMQGFSRMFRASKYTPTTADEPAVKQTGRDMVVSSFKLLNAGLGDKPYVLGTYSIADAALFYLEFWAVKFMKITLPPALQAHYERMLTRPAVQRVMAQEGFA